MLPNVLIVKLKDLAIYRNSDFYMLRGLLDDSLGIAVGSKYLSLLVKLSLVFWKKYNT